jgi:Tfp pilus assembly protein PilV
MVYNIPRGLGLLEVIIGGFVLSVVLFGVSSVWVQHQLAYRQARNRMVADFLLQSEMERVVAGGYSSLPALAAEAPSNVEVKRKTVSGLSVTSYQSSVSMTSNPSGSIRKAVVTVNYLGVGGEPVTLSAETDLFWSQ